MLTAAALMLLACSISYAQTDARSKGLVAQLNSAAGGYTTAAFKANLDSKLGAQEMAYGQSPGPITPTVAAWKSTHDNGKAAYQAWIIGKTPAQVADAKKLYAAWLTRLDAMSHIQGNSNNMDSSNGDPGSVDQTPAGVAYEQAVNEFNIDNPVE